MAAESGVDAAAIRGSGPRGRILRRDIEAALEKRDGGQSGALPRSSIPTTAPDYPPPSPRPAPELPLDGMRRAIARALQHAKGTIPHFYTRMRVEMTQALQYKAARSQNGVKLSVNDLVLRAVVLALQDEPRVNCRVGDDRIEYPEDVNLGIAVSLEDGLLVPVIAGAQRLGVTALAQEARRVISSAQQGKLIGSGQGTFTVSNLGMHGVDSFDAIINPPEGAILAVGAIRSELVPEGGGFYPRSAMQMTLSADHRAIDGFLAARFLSRVRIILETARLD
jgi:pyruvate dehydrogenase E2 component (dihydrolipoamide acetyltransferase)